MALHNERGKDGESLAGEYLRICGFELKECNWRSGHHEIDIIALKDEMVHFIEVKTRHSLEYGYPEDGVSKKKLRNLTCAAAVYLSRYPEHLKIQFDILSVLRLKDKPVEYLLIEDVYFY